VRRGRVGNSRADALHRRVAAHRIERGISREIDELRCAPRESALQFANGTIVFVDPEPCARGDIWRHVRAGACQLLNEKRSFLPQTCASERIRQHAEERTAIIGFPNASR
jgi:hypothetical protein